MQAAYDERRGGRPSTLRHGCSCFWIRWQPPLLSSLFNSRNFIRGCASCASSTKNRSTGITSARSLARSLSRRCIGRPRDELLPVNEQTRSRQSKVRVEEKIRSYRANSESPIAARDEERRERLQVLSFVIVLYCILFTFE